MACLHFISFLNRACFSNNVYHARSFFKKPLYDLYIKRTAHRIYTNSSMISALKPTVKPMTICLFKSRYLTCNKIITTFSVRHPIKITDFLRHFHTSEPRYFHPVVWVVLRPFLKLAALITGRAFRKWWRDLPPNKKKYFLQSIKENKIKLSICALICVIMSLTYYVSHLEETPITKRRRFIAFNADQLEKINQLQYQQLVLQMQKDMLPTNHPFTHRVQAVVDRIVKANWEIKEIKDKKWRVAVINSSIENAFVLPIGFVCVFTGMLSLCATDDELSVILSHEIAHCVQGHGAESISFGHLLDLISIVIIGLIWSIIPSDSLSIFTHWVYNRCKDIFLTLPYNRKIEAEADFVGLQFAAKACFDIRESSAFWAKMALVHNTMNNEPEIEFLSTHPSHETRAEYLNSIMDKAIKYRYECGCPKLKPVDPRSNVEVMAKALEVARKKYLLKNPKPVTPFHL